MKSKEFETRVAEITEGIYKIMSRSVEKGKEPEVINKATSLMAEIYELNRITEHILPISADKQKSLQNKLYRKLKETMKKAEDLLTIDSLENVRHMLKSYIRLI